MVLYRINELRKQYRQYEKMVEKLRESNDPQTIGQLKYFSERLAKVGEELGWLLAQQKDRENENR